MVLGFRLKLRKNNIFYARYEDLLTLAAPFSPSLLRVGGSAANFLTFDPDALTEENSQIQKLKERLIETESNPKVRELNANLIESYELVKKLDPSFSHPKQKVAEHLRERVLKASAYGEHHQCEAQLDKSHFSNFTMNGKEKRHKSQQKYN